MSKHHLIVCPAGPFRKATGRKKTYETRQLAEAAIAKTGNDMKAYRCSYCGKWHIATRKQR